MSLIMVEGFDHTDGTYIQIKGWLVSGPWSGLSSSYSRWQGDASPGQGVRLSYSAPNGTNFPPFNSGALYKFLPNTAGYSSLVSGIAHNWNGSPASNAGYGHAVMDWFAPNGVRQFGVWADGQHYMLVRNGTIVATGAVVDMTKWHYVELKVTFHASAGTAEVRVDGNVTPYLTFSGQTAQSSVAALANRLYVDWDGQTVSPGNACLYDDLYVIDPLTGTTNIDFLGDIRIYTLYPTSEGTHLEFSPSSGTTHFSLVNEPQVANLDASFVSGPIANLIDSYHFGQLPSSTTLVAGVAVNSTVRKDGAGFRQTSNFFRISGGTPGEAVSAPFTLLATPAISQTCHDTNPADGNAWTPSEVNNTEYGVKVTA